MATPHATSHAAPATWWSRIADVLHRVVTRYRPAAHNSAARHHRAPGRPRMVLASVAVREARNLRALREECERMSLLLEGARRGRREAVFFRARVRRAVGHVPTTARARLMHAGVAVRGAARETAAVAATAVRQAGAPAHRHIKGVNDAAHALATSAVAQLKAYAAHRAVGENSIWRQNRALA